LDESGDSGTRIGSVVFGLASGGVGSHSGPPFELHAAASLSGVWGLVLVLPAGVVAVVLHLTVPLPVLGDPESTNAGSIDAGCCVSVELVTPQSLGLADGLAHADGVTVDLSVLETVAGQEIVLGRVRSVLQLALDTHIDAGGSDVVGPGVILSVSTGVVGVAGCELGAVGIGLWERERQDWRQAKPCENNERDRSREVNSSPSFIQKETYFRKLRCIRRWKT
jgi:hypothetical protein